MKTFENFKKNEKVRYYMLLECLSDDDGLLGEYAAFYGEKNENDSYYGHFIRNKKIIDAHYSTYLYPESDKNGDIVYEDDLTLMWSILDINLKFETISKQYEIKTKSKDFNL